MHFPLVLFRTFTFGSQTPCCEEAQAACGEDPTSTVHSFDWVPSLKPAPNFWPCKPAILKMDLPGTYLVIQWLRLCTPNAGSWIQSLVRELDPACYN